MKKRFTILVLLLALVAGGGMGIVSMAIDDDTVSHELTLNCPLDAGEEKATAIQQTLDYAAGSGMDTPEAALREGLEAVNLVKALSELKQTESSSAEIRYDLNDGQGTFFVAKYGDKWVLDSFNICQSAAKRLYQS